MNLKDFPKVPELQATWVPVYLEPIMHSGERITIGIAALTDNGDARVVPVIGRRQLQCLFGKSGAEAFINLGAIALEALSKHIEKTHSITKWKPPFSGILIGKPRSMNSENLDDVITMAMRLSASLSSLPEKRSLTMEIQVAESPTEDDSWANQIRQAVERSAPHLLNNFGHRYNLIEGGRPPLFDYFGRKYVANFGKLIPRRISEGLKNARVQLWKLDIVREDSRMFQMSKYELLMWKPPVGMPLYTESELKAVHETILELEGEARTRGLSTRSVTTADEASAHIIAMDDAA